MDRISKLVDKFLHDNPDCKMKTIALEAGIGLSTLYRLMKKEQAPSSETAHRILSVVASTNLASDVMAECFPSNHYSKEYKKIMLQREYLPAAARAMSENIDSHRVYTMGLRENGIC